MCYNGNCYNGLSYNIGLSYNGMSYNIGLSYNGMSYNIGLSYNGLSYNGLSYNGLSYNGLSGWAHSVSPLSGRWAHSVSPLSDAISFCGFRKAANGNNWSLFVLPGSGQAGTPFGSTRGRSTESGALLNRGLVRLIDRHSEGEIGHQTCQFCR